MKDRKTIQGPGASELDDIVAPSPEQAKALKDGFAAHVADNDAFQQAVKELQRTQNPRSAELARERGHLDPAVVKALAPPEPGAPTPTEDTLVDASAPQEPRVRKGPTLRDLDAPALVAEPPPRRSRTPVFVVGGALAVALLVWLVARSWDGDAQAGPSATTTTTAAPPSAGPTTEPTMSGAGATTTSPTATTTATTTEVPTSTASEPISTGSAPAGPTARPSASPSARPTTTPVDTATARPTATPTATVSGSGGGTPWFTKKKGSE